MHTFLHSRIELPAVHGVRLDCWWCVRGVAREVPSRFTGSGTTDQGVSHAQRFATAVEAALFHDLVEPHGEPNFPQRDDRPAMAEFLREV